MRLTCFYFDNVVIAIDNSAQPMNNLFWYELSVLIKIDGQGEKCQFGRMLSVCIVYCNVYHAHYY